MQTIYQSTEKRKATIYLISTIPVILPIGLSKRGARRRRSAWRSASLCLFFRSTFSLFFIIEKVNLRGTEVAREFTKQQSLAGSRESWQNFYDRWTDLLIYTMWDRLQWRRNVAQFNVWVPIVSWDRSVIM